VGLPNRPINVYSILTPFLFFTQAAPAAFIFCGHKGVLRQVASGHNIYALVHI